ncbi:AAA family ATPase [Stakelama marina]|uniref:AAA family ATPase n=1 Tax=Stakelama marina TaxID=2826939 RepID=A0A8T4IBT9_9SPHN|nr:bifunctional aminoglycoside phosphotransferase/ATP-binding protein [Stakelama marina]MBR0551294.1 AAA family ATPase [Stakelama marina]
MPKPRHDATPASGRLREGERFWRDAERAQHEVVEWLASGAAFGGDPPDRVDTHAASIFLSGDRAWKLKRAVRFDYLDFSTPELRRKALEAELRLNRRTAPDLYLAVHPVTREGGALAISGGGGAVDWLLEMRRFPQDKLLDRMAERDALDDATLLALTDRVAAYHAASPVDRGGGGAAALREIIDGNAVTSAAFLDLLDGEISGLIEKQRHAAEHLSARLDARARLGRVRHVHGDLHLGNIAMIDGAPTPFDCIEFDDELATIDVLYDLAFLLMDLISRGRGDQANLVFNRYCDLSGDEDGVALMPLFLSVRATIRAHVLAATSRRNGDDAAHAARAREFLRLAHRLIEPQPAALVAIGGLSGSGKSTVARRIAGAFGVAPGARVLRSDILRKRLANVPPETTLPPSAYTHAMNEMVYSRLGEHAGELTGSGSFVIADAVFADKRERRMIAQVARSEAVPFIGIWLDVAEATRVERIGARAPDASDADAGVARVQSGYDLGLIEPWRSVDANGSAEAVADRIRSVVGDALTMAGKGKPALVERV